MDRLGKKVNDHFLKPLIKLFTGKLEADEFLKPMAKNQLNHLYVFFKRNVLIFKNQKIIFY